MEEMLGQASMGSIDMQISFGNTFTMGSAARVGIYISYASTLVSLLMVIH